MIPIPFASQSYQNRSLPVSAQQCFNLYPEFTPEGKSQIVLHGTPGLVQFSANPQVNSVPVRGMHEFNGKLHAVIGDKLYRITTLGVCTEIGTIEGSEPVGIADNGTQLVIVTGGKGYVYSSSLSQITDTDFPQASTVGFINQRMVYDSSYGFTYTDLDAAETMAGTVNGTGSPDQCIAVLVDHMEVWIFGEKSTEVYYNSTSLVDPFERLQGAFLEKGCAAKFSAVKIDNSVYWLGDDFGVYRADGYIPVRISTPSIEHAIQSYSSKSDAIAFTYSEEGHTFYQLTFPSAGKTWVYDAATQRWHERGNYTEGRHRANCYCYCYGKHLVGDFKNGKIYEMSLDVFTDGSDPIQRIAVSPPINTGNTDVFMSKLWIDFESGTGLTTGQGFDPQAMLTHSDDGGKTWSNERWTTIGKIGKYSNKAIWRRCGTFVQRMFKMVVSDPVKVVIIGAYGEF